MAGDRQVVGEDAVLSSYVKALAPDIRERYKEKIVACNGIDPYTLKKCELSFNLSDYPTVSYPDILNYLVLHTSFCTTKQMKAYKSMEAYNSFVSWRVHEIGTISISFTIKYGQKELWQYIFCITGESFPTM